MVVTNLYCTCSNAYVIQCMHKMIIIYPWRKQVRSPCKGFLENLQDEVEVADILLLIAHKLPH